MVDAEHALGYPGDLDLAPDRAPLREFVVAPQRGDAAHEARARRQLVMTGNTGFDAVVELGLVRSFADAGVDSGPWA